MPNVKVISQSDAHTENHHWLSSPLSASVSFSLLFWLSGDNFSVSAPSLFLWKGSDKPLLMFVLTRDKRWMIFDPHSSGDSNRNFLMNASVTLWCVKCPKTTIKNKKKNWRSFNVLVSWCHLVKSWHFLTSNHDLYLYFSVSSAPEGLRVKVSNNMFDSIFGLTDIRCALWLGLGKKTYLVRLRKDQGLGSNDLLRT